MPDVSMTVISEGHLRVTVDTVVVEIVGQGRLHVSAFTGQGGTPSLTYASRPTLLPAAAPPPPPPPPPKPRPQPRRPEPPPSTPASVPEAAAEDAPEDTPAAIPEIAPDSEDQADTVVETPEELAARLEWETREIKERGPIEREKWGDKNSHPIGVSAPGQNNPVRYAFRKIIMTYNTISPERLRGILEQIHILTGMTITRNPGESVTDTQKRAKRELIDWFEVYASEHGMPFDRNKVRISHPPGKSKRPYT